MVLRRVFPARARRLSRAFGAVVLVLTPLSCSSSNDAGSGSGLTCLLTIGTGPGSVEECLSYAGTQVPTTCIEGSPVSSCPTKHQLACCENLTVAAAAESFTYGYCVYDTSRGDAAAIDLSSEQMTCTESGGAWTTK